MRSRRLVRRQQLRTSWCCAESAVVHRLDIARGRALVHHIQVEQILWCIHVKIVAADVGSALACAHERASASRYEEGRCGSWRTVQPKVC